MARSFSPNPDDLRTFPDGPAGFDKFRTNGLAGHTEVLECDSKIPGARRKASPLLVQGVGQTIAIYLARNYAELVKEPHGRSLSLPGFKLRQITDWMREHIAEDFNLEQLAALAGLSRFHFHRLFKTAVGESPSHYHIKLRMDRRGLRHSNKKHFSPARIFRKFCQPPAYETFLPFGLLDWSASLPKPAGAGAHFRVHGQQYPHPARRRRRVFGLD